MNVIECIQGITIENRSERREILLNQKETNKPLKSFGRLEEIGYKITEIIGINEGKLKAQVVIFAGDHGIAETGLSAFPKTHTAKVVNLLNSQRLPINKLANNYGIPIQCYDVGIDGVVDYSDIVHNAKIRNGTRNMLLFDAMEKNDVLKAIEKGIEAAKKCYENEVKITAMGEIGICNTISTSILTAILCGINAENVTDRGTGVYGERLQQKREVISKLVERNRGQLSDLFVLLCKVGGYEICADIGFLLGCSYYKIPVIIDGYISSIAALIAYRLQPMVKKYIFASHMSSERGHKHIMQELDLEPVIDFGMRYGMGTGATIALPLYIAAYELVNV